MDTTLEPTKEPVGATSRAGLWAILAVVLIADMLDLMDSTLTNIAAPTIVAELGGGAGLLKWLGSAYALALGSLLVLGGRLGDRFGQRRVFLIGITGFTLASLACGLAWSPTVLVIARLIQGGFGALLIPQGLAIMTAVFPRDFKSVAFATFGPMMALASIGGPILGAYIVNANWFGLSWRPMFLINIVFGGLGLVVAARILPRSPADPKVVLDAPGSVLLSLAVLGTIAGLIEGPELGWGLWPLSLLAIGVAAFAAFAVRQAKAANPLILPSLLRNRGFTAGLLAGLGYFAVVTGMAYVVSLFCQQALHRDPVQTALTGIVPMSVGIIVASFIAAPLIGKLGRNLVAAGVLTTALGAGWLWLTVYSNGLALGTWDLVGPMVVTGLGMGLTFGTLFDIAVGDASPDEAGSAGGSLSAVQQLAGAIGSAVIASIWLAYGTDTAHAMQVCLMVVGIVCLAVLAIIPLLPRRAANTGHGE